MGWNILFSLLSGIAGALIGTYLGSVFLHWHKVKNVRAIAIKALNIFKSYAEQKKSYAEATCQFNNDLTISEKRAVVVALHKLGVPFKIPTKESFNIKNLKFKNVIIEANENTSMIEQINKGNCDNLFFSDVESYFTSNLQVYAMRNVGKKYVEEVFAKSSFDISDQVRPFKNPDNWERLFTPGELQTISVLLIKLWDQSYFTSEGKINLDTIQPLLNEIEIGLWDKYLSWDLDAYLNMREQRRLTNIAQTMLTIKQQQPITIKPAN